MWWMWVVAFLVVFAVVAVLSLRHRGSQGSSKELDVPSDHTRNSPLDHSYPTGVGDAGGAGGSGGV